MLRERQTSNRYAQNRNRVSYLCSGRRSLGRRKHGRQRAGPGSRGRRCIFPRPWENTDKGKPENIKTIPGAGGNAEGTEAMSTCFFFRWDISVICLIVVLKSPSQCSWAYIFRLSDWNYLIFFDHFKNISVYDPKTTEKKQMSTRSRKVRRTMFKRICTKRNTRLE